MPSSGSEIEASVVSLLVKVAGQALSGEVMVKGIEISYQINRIPMAFITIAEFNDLENDGFELDNATFDPGKEVEIALGFGEINETVFKGIIVKNSLKLTSGSAPEIVLDCRHKMAKLTFNKKNKAHKEVKDSDVMNAIISEAGLSATVDATKVQHPQLYQHQCTDWDFMLNRAEVNGMYLFATPDGIKIGKPKVSGSAALSLEYGVGILSADLELDARNQVVDVTSYGWDAKKMIKTVGISGDPGLNSQGSVQASKLKQVLNTPYSQYASGFTTQEELVAWSDARIMRARMSRIQGTVTFFGSSKPKVGDLIDLSKISKKFSGSAFVGGVSHHVAEGAWETTVTLGINNLPYYEEQKTGDIPAGGHMPAVNGLHIGLVTKIHEDPDSLVRIAVKFPVGKEDVEVWARLSTFYASNAAGTFFYPEVNDEVIVGFINDDPQDAIVLGSVYGKNAPPHQPEEKNNTKGFVTRTKMKLTFDEEKKIITIETPGGNSVVLDDDKKSITLTDANKNTVTLDDAGISMDTEKDVKIKATGKVSIEGTGGVEIKSNADLKMEGLNVTAEAKVKMAVKGNAQAEFSASGQTVVKGAMVMIN